MKINWYVKHHHHNYYSLVEPYRVNGRNRHRKIYYFGELTPEELQRINHGLEVMKSHLIKTMKIEDIIFENYWRYLDVAFLSNLWDQWNLSKVFPRSEDKDVQTYEIAKILTIYRCLDAGSYLSAVGWFKDTALDLILSINNQHINTSRIFRELDEIEDEKTNIEYYLYTTLKERDKESVRIVFYDLTDSYFEGRICELAKSGITKSNGFRRKKIVLALLVNSKGYPFAWDVLEDYTADVKTIKGLSVKWKTQFKFGDHEVILVFDRGMVSDENLKHLEDQKQPYIAALDKNQIPGIKGVEIERFELLDEKNNIEQIIKTGFEKYDGETYYEDRGMIDGRRYVLVFNPTMFRDERNSRRELIQKANDYLKEKSKALAKAKKSRRESVTRNKIDGKLKDMKARKFVDYDLEPIVINSGVKKVKSFSIVSKETEDTQKAIKNSERTDGLWVIVTSVQSKKEDKNGLTAGELISAYRDKNQIEQAFRDVKSFIKIQPFNVWKPKHVRAHYTICVLSYLLDITIANRLREKDIGIKSPQKVYEILMKGVVGKISIKNNFEESLKLMNLQPCQKNILELFQSESVVKNKHLKSMKINY